MRAGADIPLAGNDDKLAALLDYVKTKGIELYLCCRRSRKGTFSVINYIEQNNLSDKVHFYPYYDVCRDFPFFKQDMDVWFEASDCFSPFVLPAAKKRVLFATMFHPQKLEGNSHSIRFWLDNFRRSGYKIDILYYKYDSEIIQMVNLPSEQVSSSCDRLIEVEVESMLVGRNQNGLNVHVDDWCGIEALEAMQKATTEAAYDICFTNYSFFSAIFEKCHAYTKKILLPHDIFTNRNKKMLADGYPDSGWMSITEDGERLACGRADTIICQNAELDDFKKLAPTRVNLYAIPPLNGEISCKYSSSSDMVVGYIGSGNWVNEQNLADFMAKLNKSASLRGKVKLLVAGGVCSRLREFCYPDVFDSLSPCLLGMQPDKKKFFEKCSILINPDRGGTGIKIKTLDALAHGMPLLCTEGASFGVPTKSPFHHAENTGEMIALLEKIVECPKILASLANLSKRLFQELYKNNLKNIDSLLS